MAQQVSVNDALAAFLDETRGMERSLEIKRVNKAFKLDPFEILDLDHSATTMEVKKKYRDLSLLCHPDKAKAEERKDAQVAFQKLGKARDDLLDESKRKTYQMLSRTARENVEAERTKLFKVHKKKWMKEFPEAVESDCPPLKYQKTKDEAIKFVFKNLIVDQAWRKRVYLKKAQEMEAKADQEITEIRETRKQKLVEQKKWGEARKKRVGNWRDFQKKKSKKRKLRQMIKATDAQPRQKKEIWEQRAWERKPWETGPQMS